MSARAESRVVPRAMMLGILGATLAPMGCWLALGLQDRTQAGETAGTGGTAGVGPEGTGGPGGAGPEGSGCDGGSRFGEAQVYGSQSNPTAITVDPGHAHVFWIDDGDDCAGAAVMKLSKVADGGLPPSAVAIAMNQKPLNGLVSDGVALWTAQTATTNQHPDGGSCNIYSGIAEIPVTGATVPPELFGRYNHAYPSMFLVGKTVAFADDLANGGSIWVGNVTTGQLLNDGGPLQGDAGQVNAIAGEAPSTFYWQASGHIWGASSGVPPTCFAVAAGATSLVAANGWLYWTDVTDGTIRKVKSSPPSCTTPGTVIAHDPGSPQGLAVDSTDVYWASNMAGGAVHTVPVTASSAVVPAPVYVASKTGVPVSVATDGVFVYATIAIDDQVVAVPILCH